MFVMRLMSPIFPMAPPVRSHQFAVHHSNSCRARSAAGDRVAAAPVANDSRSTQRIGAAPNPFA
jgi:hypothetical protein